MPASSDRVIQKYLEDAAAFEQSSGGQFREFASEGDDEEVQGVFLAHAEQTRLQYERITARLAALNGSGADRNDPAAKLAELSPKLAHAGHTQEEQIVQNLLAGLALASGECAMYESLAVIAAAAGDTATERLAREIQAEEAQIADKLWHFIPSRSKIAYNMLTAWEADPAIETKLADNRVV